MKVLLSIFASVLMALSIPALAQDDEKKTDEPAPPSNYDLDIPAPDPETEVAPEDLKEVIKTNNQDQVVQRFTGYLDAHGRMIKHGEYQEWYDNGQKAREVTYVHGRPDGRQVWYHTNGKVWMEFSTKMGKRDGAYMEYWRNGKRKTTIIYRDGKILRRQ